MAEEDPLAWETEPSENFLDDRFLYRGVFKYMWQTWKNLKPMSSLRRLNI